MCNKANVLYSVVRGKSRIVDYCQYKLKDGTQGRIRWGHPISGGFSYYVLKFSENNGTFQTEITKRGSFGLLGKIQPNSNYEVRIFTGMHVCIFLDIVV